MLSWAAAGSGWNSCLLAGTRTGGLGVWGGAGWKASFQPLPSLTCPQWASRGCLRNINLITCSCLLPVPKTAVKSEWGCKLWAPAGFRRTNAHRPLWEVPLSPGCHIQRVIQVQQLWGVRPWVSDPNLQTFGSLHHLEYTWPLVGIDILVISSACWCNTNIWLAIAGSGELLVNVLWICSFNGFQEYKRLSYRRKNNFLLGLKRSDWRCSSWGLS